MCAVQEYNITELADVFNITIDDAADFIYTSIVV